MANTINNGPAKSLAYYPVSGTDIDDTGANLKWDPATNQVTLVGRLQVGKNVASTNDTSLSLVHYGSNFVPVYISRSLGTTTNPVKVIAGNALGGISFTGRADSTFRTGAYINAVVDGAVSDTSMPSKIVFGTHNGSTLAVRAELSKLGELKVNTIKDYSGGILTLNPATKLDLGVASKISISGGSAGQVLSFNSNGVLEWTDIASSELYDPIIRNAINAGTGIAFNKATGYITNTITSTDLIAEGANRLYYTDARARNALSVVAGRGGYNSSTGQLSIPTNNNQLINGAEYLTVVTWNSIIGKSDASGPAAIQIGRLTYQALHVPGDWDPARFNTIAIGNTAGRLRQGDNSIAIGAGAGSTQGLNAIAIGGGAGASNQGNNAIAIGNLAGNLSQNSNSIILNATGQALNNQTTGLFIKPIRSGGTTTALYYDTGTGEITHAEEIPVVRETPPTTATSSGITGQIAYDSNYVYICTATNTWKRSALSSW
jgi:hypothetical protein